MLGQTLAHPVWMRPGFFVSGPQSKEFPVFDDILELFGRKREHDARRTPEAPELRLPFLDDEEQEERERSRREGERQPGRHSPNRPTHDDDWF